MDHIEARTREFLHFKPQPTTIVRVAYIVRIEVEANKWVSVIQNQPGLKLKLHNSQVEILVIDQIEQPAPD